MDAIDKSRFTDARSPGTAVGHLVGRINVDTAESLKDYQRGVLGNTLADVKPRGDARFHALLKRIGDLHDLKQGDYGSDEDPFANVRASGDFGISPWIGTMVRANDKMKRIQKFAKKKSLKNESLQDSLMDLAVYSLIALVLFEEETEKKL